MKFERTQVFNFENALRGMRNPLESWDKSDSHWDKDEDGLETFIVCPNDLELARSLIKAGSPHRKFLRQIFISVDITAPIYWWKEMDTYKISVTRDSCSTMHKLTTTPIRLDCFECPGLIDVEFVEKLEKRRQLYLKTKNKEDWKWLIVNLPESWLQKSTITMNYENLLNIIRWRHNHKLTEWSYDFMRWAHNLPYVNGLGFFDFEND